MSNKMALDALTEFEKTLTTWANAYPESVFPVPDLAKAAKLLEAGGMTLDAISADAMRHIAKTMHADFADCRAAIAVLQAEQQGWMPIETAPKDGTRILVCNKADYVYPARWQGVESGKPADWPQGWRDDVMFVAADGIVSWMQLPATPPKD